jgi:GT2 family glycosyltransferase
MSALQSLILDEFKLGVKPIFIVCDDENDREYKSLLLSNHLGSPYGDVTRPLTAFDNYFSTSAFRNYIAQIKYLKSNEISQKLKLYIDEGFDTQLLYGLSIPTSILPFLNIKSDFKEAHFIIVYNNLNVEDTNVFEKNEKLNLAEFVDQNSIKATFIHSNHLVVNPLLVLGHFANLFKTTIQSEEKILPQKMLKAKDYFKNISNAKSNAEIQDLNSRDCLQKPVSSKQVLILFSIHSLQQADRFIQSIQILSYYFQDKIFCEVFLDSTIEQTELKNIITSYSLSEFVKFHVTSSNTIETINKIISNDPAEYIFYDNLQSEYNIIALFNAIFFNEYELACPVIQSDSQSQSLTLNSLLTDSIPQFACLIKKSIWNSTGKFDSILNPKYIIWDFCIRATYQLNVKPYAIPAFALPITTNNTEKLKSAYQEVINKHQTIFESSLKEIIQAISSQQQLTIKHKISLQEKISTLTQVLTHSKEELFAYQDLTAQLQHRISYLENNWYVKLRSKLERIKKIFFKKKSPGSGTLKRILQFIRFILSKSGLGILRKLIVQFFKKLYLISEKRPVKIIYLDESNQDSIFTYHDWITNKLGSKNSQTYYTQKLSLLNSSPKISIIMPVYNTPLKYLKEAIESVINQNYQNWELCIADDLSTELKVKKILRSYAAKDPRIKVVYRESNGHISAASNSALELTTGEFVVLMDHDDLLAYNCIAEIVLAIQHHPECDIVYSDEDKIDEQGIHQVAHFKPDWAPDHLLSRNYVGHVTVIRKTILDKINGFRLGFEGSQDYDLLLRATELTQKIVHIPKVLYHWRIHTLSAAQSEEVKPYAYIAAKKALQEAIERRGLHGEIKYLSGLRGYKINYFVEKQNKVSIIIPTKDQTTLLKNTIDSILDKTNYTNYEIIILNNNSITTELSEFLDAYKNKYPDLISVIEAHFPFNFSKLMNIGVRHAKGDYILFLNNDVEVIHADWLTTMVSYVQQERIGAVGCKLLYPDDTIQHAGVIVGLGGVAGHTFVGAYKEEAGYFNYIQSVNNFSAVTAACLMVRKDAFEAVNGMDEQFEVEYNDVDFCLKLMETGYNNVYLPQVELYHYESATRGHPHQSKPSYERHLKEMKLFKLKWQKYIDHDPHYNPNLNLGVHDFSMNFNA